MFNLPEEVIFYIYQLYFKDYVLNELLSKYNNQLKRDPKDNFKISFIIFKLIMNGVNYG